MILEALDLVVNEIHAYSDNENLVKLVQDVNTPGGKSVRIIRTIQTRVLDMATSMYLTHIKRQFNGVADDLADKAAKGEIVCSWRNERGRPLDITREFLEQRPKLANLFREQEVSDNTSEADDIIRRRALEAMFSDYPPPPEYSKEWRRLNDFSDTEEDHQ